MPAPPEPKPEPESCPICMDPYKGKKVVKITCQYCPAGACRGCQQRYLLQSYEDPHCMECKRGWSPEFMADNFPLSFRNDTLRKHRRKILFEREKATLPAMQAFVEYRREIRRLDKLINAQQDLIGAPMAGRGGRLLLRGATPVDTPVDTPPDPAKPYALFTTAYEAWYTANGELTQTRRDILTQKEWLVTPPAGVAEATTRQKLADLRKKREELKKKVAELEPVYKQRQGELNELQRVLSQLCRDRWTYHRRYEGHEVGGGGAAAAERREFIMKCPDDGCRGFLSQAYKCGTCSKHTCSKCLYVLGAEKECGHVCKPEEVESAKAIRAETRPCPKCGTRIFKIDGCDQMWCTMDGCQTAFSWNTGHVVTGNVHNPHYYEWLRRTGGGQAAREHGDIPCGGLPTAWQFQAVVYRNLYLTNEERNGLYEIHRNVRELVDFRLREFPARPAAMANKEIDVQYLMQELDEAEWKRQLEFTEAKFRRKKEIGQILQMAATAASDALNRIVQQGQALGVDHGDQFADWIRNTGRPELEALREFVNDSLRKLAKREHMAVPQLGAEWKWEPLRALYRPPLKKKGVAAAAETNAGLAAATRAEPEQLIPTGVGLVGLADPADAENEIIEILD